MKLTFMTALLSAGVMTTAPLFAAPVNIETIHVSAETEDLEPVVSERYVAVVADITNALGEALEPLRVEPSSHDMYVEIRELSYYGDVDPGDETQFNQISAWVNVTDMSDEDEIVASFPVNLVADDPENPGMIDPTRSDFYAALVDGFAAKVYEEMTYLDTETIAEES